MSDSVRPRRQKPTRLPCPWDSPGKNTGVGCHFLLQCMKVKCEREVAQSCPTLSDPMDYSLPGSSIHGIFQARVLEWGAIAFSVQTHKVHHMSCRKPCSHPMSYLSLTCFYLMTLASLTSRGFLQQVTLFLVKMLSFPGWDLVWAIHQTEDPVRMWGWGLHLHTVGATQCNSVLMLSTWR